MKIYLYKNVLFAVLVFLSHMTFAQEEKICEEVFYHQIARGYHMHGFYKHDQTNNVIFVEIRLAQEMSISDILKIENISAGSPHVLCMLGTYNHNYNGFRATKVTSK